MEYKFIEFCVATTAAQHIHCVVAVMKEVGSPLRDSVGLISIKLSSPVLPVIRCMLPGQPRRPCYSSSEPGYPEPGYFCPDLPLACNSKLLVFSCATDSSLHCKHQAASPMPFTHCLAGLPHLPRLLIKGEWRRVGSACRPTGQ